MISSRTSGGRHGAEDLPECLVAALGNVVLEALRIDAPGVLGHDADLAREECGLRHGRRVGPDCLQRGQDFGHIVRTDLPEELPRLWNLYERAGGTQPEATNALDGDVLDAVRKHLLPERGEHVVGLRR